VHVANIRSCESLVDGNLVYQLVGDGKKRRGFSTRHLACRPDIHQIAQNPTLGTRFVLRLNSTWLISSLVHAVPC